MVKRHEVLTKGGTKKTERERERAFFLSRFFEGKRKGYG
jgi:hypothetical protein